MANRSIVVTLRANVADFKTQFDAATKAAEQTARATEQSAQRADTAMGRMVQSAQDNRQAWDQAGATLTAFGAATLGGLGLATKAAMDWESAWAGVQKTVDGTAPQMVALEEGLRGLARELPASHAEIAAVAEAAGQLGIATPNVLSFTRTMIDMGEATNMSADQAATSLSRFMNITQTSQSDVGRLGAAVVGLGNNFATTESEIVDMSMRIAGAGEQAGLTEGEIFGMATALSSVGIEAEAGGTAISRTMKRIGMEVDTGGDKLDMFAQVAGMSAEQFSAAWREDPAAAMEAFVTGLSNTEQLGMSTNQVLSELGITAIRESDSLLRLSAAGDVLGEAMAMGNAEFEKGTALIEEASKRYETAESRIRMAGNAIVDSGISIGSVFLPVVADVADRVAGLAGAFADLPAPVQGAVGALGGVAGAGALAAGSFLLIFPRVMDTVGAFKTLKSDMPGVASGLGKVGKAAAVAAGAFATLNVASSVTESFRDGAEQAELLAVQLLNAAEAGGITAGSINDLVSSTVPFGVSVHGVGDALSLVDPDPVSAGLEGLTKALLGVPTTADVATESLGSLDGALSRLVSGGQLDTFSNAFAEAVKDAEAYGFTAEDLIANLPALREALTPIATEMGVQATNANLAKIALEGIDPAIANAASGMEDGAGAAGEFEEGLSGVEQAAADAATATDDYYDSLRQLADEFITAERAAMDYADSLEETAKAAAENGKAWEDGTEAADANKRALLDLAEQALATADSLSAEGKSGTFLQQAREDLIDVATEMTGSRELAEEYVDQLLGTPEEISTIVELETEQAKADWAALWDELGYHPPQVPVGADTDPAKGDVDEFTGLVGSTPPPEVPIDADTTPAIGEVSEFSGLVGETRPPDVPVGANIEPGMTELYNLEMSIMASGGTVTINGDATPGDQVLDTLMGIINSSDGTVTIDGQSVPADRALSAAIRAINDGRGVVEIDGNNSGARSSTDSAVGHANRSSGTIGVHANTGAANSAINSAARDRYSTIHVRYNYTNSSFSSPGSPRGNNPNYRAAGGPVFGPGTETSDSVPAMLSTNEHVFAAREVKAAGGHQAIYSLRQQLMAGARTIHLATGGAADGSVGAVQSMPFMRAQAQSSGPVVAQVDQAGIESAMVRGLSSATVIAQVSDRVAANLYQRGASASRAFGGAR